ncbi:hypothetical protein PAHAL_8G012100 [Panicum hallii]|uniref:Uncharacterized protein n=1 Tax=Panicum hallii TaxID=206008 RepID=A0A2T8I747_9POAL|nr:hypothetical protein PAHAL_8G012100 [Panicum hallii]
MLHNPQPFQYQIHLQIPESHSRAMGEAVLCAPGRHGSCRRRRRRRGGRDESGGTLRISYPNQRAFVDIPAGDMAPAEVAPPPAIALSGFPRSPPSHSLAQNYLRPRARAAN